MTESFNGIVIEDCQSFPDPVHLDNLQILGSASFGDTVEAERIEIAGEARFGSFATCDRLDVSGEALFLKRLLTETLRVSGSARFLGRVWSEVAVFEGRGTLNAPFSLARLVLKPNAEVQSSSKLKVDRMTVNGKISVSAKVSCTDAEVISCARSEIFEIFADRLTVRYKARADRPEIASGEFLLTASFADTGSAELEYAQIGQLFCDSAVIGRGCRIGELIYRDKVEITDGAAVERLSKA